MYAAVTKSPSVTTTRRSERLPSDWLPSIHPCASALDMTTGGKGVLLPTDLEAFELRRVVRSQVGILTHSFPSKVWSSPWPCVPTDVLRSAAKQTADPHPVADVVGCTYSRLAGWGRFSEDADSLWLTQGTRGLTFPVTLTRGPQLSAFHPEGRAAFFREPVPCLRRPSLRSEPHWASGCNIWSSEEAADRMATGVGAPPRGCNGTMLDFSILNEKYMQLAVR